MNATCARDEVVVIHSAKYGRMKLGRCVTKNYGHIGCGTDVMSYMESTCSGRQECIISVISLHNKRSCPKDFKSYLQAGYHCLKVEYTAAHSCRGRGYVPVRSKRGYLSSDLATSTGVGSVDCPWYIQMEPHQRINLTLIDYTQPDVNNFNSFDSGFRPPIRCQNEYATVWEGDGKPNASICATGRRETSVYLSRTHAIRVSISDFKRSRTMPVPFIISYSAVGCPPIEPPAHSWITSDGEHAIIQCNETEETWFLNCQGTHWVGTLGNCSSIAVLHEEWTITGMFKGVTSFPFGLLIVIALGVAIGVAIGLVMLVTVLAYMKRRRRRKVRSRSNYLLKTMSQENADNHSKANLDTSTDMSPMLLKQPSHPGDYSTWQRCRPLPAPSSIPSSLHQGGASDSPQLAENSAHPQALRHTLPRITIPKVFTTFKPEQDIPEGYDSPPPERIEYILRPCDEGPYYFKLDTGVGCKEPGCKDSDSMDGLKQPDLVPGCIECQDRTESRSRHSVV